MSLGSLLKRHRTVVGLTQEELAEKAQVSARTVSDIERGLRSRVYRDTAGRLADALGLVGPLRAEFESAARGRRPKTVRKVEALPVPPTPLVGRDRELDIVLDQLGRPDTRLLTLIGPGGIGKTRLAFEVAHRARFTGGVSFLQLADTGDAARVVPLIGRSLGMSGANDPTIDQISQHLGGDRVLIVLDTFEHLMDAAVDVAALLAACPGVAVLATSREPLRIRGEHELLVPTLELPPSEEIEDVVHSPATAMFIQRARAVRPSLLIDVTSARAIAEICRGVNGLPLAIELAAARSKHLALEELRDQICQRLDVLTGGPRDLPRRQQTMRDTVSWSYDLLAQSEQKVFRDLCLFSGGWTLDAASAVCGTDVLGEVSALVDKSLVIRSEGEGTRYSMLDVIRDYGAELRPSEGAAERHLTYFLSLAEEAEPELAKASQGPWLTRLGREHNNIREALRRAISRGQAEVALRLGGALWRFWLLEGHLSEGRSWLREALGLGKGTEPAIRAKALWGAAWLAYHQGDYADAERCGEELQQLARISADPIQARNWLTIRGILDLAHGRLAEATASLERAVDLMRGQGMDWLMATSLLNLGMAMAHTGDRRALSVLEQAGDIYAELGDQHYAVRTILYSGFAELLSGGEESASSFFRRSLIDFWELADLWGTATALAGIAALAGDQGLPERAATIGGAAEALWEATTASPFPADRTVVKNKLRRAKATLDDASWQEAWQNGRRMTTEKAVDYALASR